MRFYIDGLIPPVEGTTAGQRWNGWECPAFGKASMDAILVAWNTEHGTFSGVNDAQDGPEERPCAWFDEKARTFSFYDPTSDQIEHFEPSMLGGVETWDFRNAGWTWNVEDAATTAYRAFVQKMMGRVGLGFHPDTPLSEYVENDEPVFTATEIAALGAEVDAAYGLALGTPTTPGRDLGGPRDLGDLDPYAIAVEETERFMQRERFREVLREEVTP